MVDQNQVSGLVVLKSWHVIILLIVQLLGLGLGFGITYGRLAQQNEDMNARLLRIEDSKMIGRDEFDAFRDEIRADFRTLEQAIIDKNLK